MRDKGHFTHEQAETLAEALGEASQDNLATKADIELLKAAIESVGAVTKAAIESLRAATKADIADVRADLFRWTVGAIGFQPVVILGAVFALVHVIKP